MKIKDKHNFTQNLMELIDKYVNREISRSNLQEELNKIKITAGDDLIDSFLHLNNFDNIEFDDLRKKIRDAKGKQNYRLFELKDDEPVVKKKIPEEVLFMEDRFQKLNSERQTLINELNEHDVELYLPQKIYFDSNTLNMWRKIIEEGNKQ